jgi:polysaccharide export outer membrane protein
VFLVLALMLLGCTEPDHGLIPPAQPVDVTSGLAPGDTFEVRVFGEEDIGGTFQVQEDGSIDFPLIGRVVVRGKTQGQVATLLEDALAAGYLRDPHVTVVLTARENLEVSVLGQVQHPGTFPYIERLSLVQAISDAGGLTDIAHARRVKLTRKTEAGVQTFDVSLKAITEGREADILLQPGDIIFVPESPL